MRVNTGYRDLNKPFDDCNIYNHPEVSSHSLTPVTRVIPDCGHTYFVRGHSPNSLLITRFCTGCVNQQAFREAKRNWENTKWTQTGVEIRG